MMMRRRGPGLVRGVARTAVVAGTATAVSGRVARRQARKFEEKDQAAYDDQQQQQAYEQPPPEQQQYAQPPPQQYAPEPAAAEPGVDDEASEIRKLASLRDQGLLTEEEFAAKKKQILGI
ncbi:MAG TPA: SHOCT domain-containing protein [Actinomycetota bacterium]|nr:SHOCT domain-containing protein [Actinomycetota bacterium]